MSTRFLTSINIDGSETVRGNEYVTGNSSVTGDVIITDTLSAKYGTFIENLSAKYFYGNGSNLTGITVPSTNMSDYLPLSGGTLNGNLTGLNATFTNLSSTYATVTNYEDFLPTTTPTYKEGRMFYDAAYNSLAYFNDIPGNSVHVGQEIQLKVKNSTGTVINKGKVVYVSGSTTGDLPDITLALSNALSSSLVIGVVNQDIAINASGYVIALGKVEEVNTAGFNAGEDLYLSPTTPGGYTNIMPSAPNYAIQVGVCLYAHANHGKILVLPSILSVNANNIVGTIPVSGGGTGQTTINGIISSLSATKTSDIQVYSTPGTYTWNKPVGAKFISLTLIGGGGGGGSGSKASSGTTAGGGGGGGGGGLWDGVIPATQVADTVTGTVGSGGSGGIGVTVNGNGTPGGPGTLTSFDLYIQALSGGGGVGGVTPAATAAGGAGGVYSGSNGGAGGTSTGGGGTQTNRGGSGGGGGGAVTATPVTTNGGSGGYGATGLAAGGAGGTGNGGSGGSGNWTGIYSSSASSGGGGGAGATTTSGGFGGNGGGFGTGGGGGGATVASGVVMSGSGGNGAPGLAVICTIF